MHFKAPDIGLDLGTCNTVVYVKNEGIVISEPTLVISRRGDKKPIAVGEDAQRMYGRTSDAEIAIHPIRNGMIANYDATVLLLRAFISKAVGESNLVKPRLVMSIPSEIDEVNRKALTAAVRACGLKKVYLIEKPWRRRLAQACPSLSRKAAWWWMSAVERRRLRSYRWAVWSSASPSPSAA